MGRGPALQRGWISAGAEGQVSKKEVVKPTAATHRRHRPWLGARFFPAPCADLTLSADALQHCSSRSSSADGLRLFPTPPPRTPPLLPAPSKLQQRSRGGDEGRRRRSRTPPRLGSDYRELGARLTGRLQHVGEDGAAGRAAAPAGSGVPPAGSGSRRQRGGGGSRRRPRCCSPPRC